MAVFLTPTQWSMVCGGGEECMLAQLPTIWLVSGPLWAVDGQWLVSSTADVPISPSSLRSLPMSSITKNFSEDTATYLKSDEIELLRDSYCIYLLVFWCMGQGLKLPESQLYISNMWVVMKIKNQDLRKSILYDSDSSRRPMRSTTTLR